MIYRSVLKHADLVQIIGKDYTYDIFHRRNEWMVNHSNRIIAVYDGTPGGTQNTINYARKTNVEVLVV